MLKSLSSKPLPALLGSRERRLKKAKLIACDLDGTLLNQDEMVGVRTAILMKRIIELGIPFVLITARHHQAVEPYAEELRMTLPIISLDGAITRYPHAPAP